MSTHLHPRPRPLCQSTRRTRTTPTPTRPASLVRTRPTHSVTSSTSRACDRSEPPRPARPRPLGSHPRQSHRRGRHRSPNLTPTTPLAPPRPLRSAYRGPPDAMRARNHADPRTCVHHRRTTHGSSSHRRDGHTHVRPGPATRGVPGTLDDHSPRTRLIAHPPTHNKARGLPREPPRLIVQRRRRFLAAARRSARLPPADDDAPCPSAEL